MEVNADTFDRKNTGHDNTGNCNTGHNNTGYRNTGDFNTGQRNTGFFCTETPLPMFFDKPVDMSWREAFSVIPKVSLRVGVEFVPSEKMTDYEKENHPNHLTWGGYLKKHELPLKEVFPEAWAKMSEEERQKWIDLPNFDAEKFMRITGVDVRTFNAADEITINGIKYRRV